MNKEGIEWMEKRRRNKRKEKKKREMREKGKGKKEVDELRKGLVT
jgi:hypothetical protein